MQDRNTHGKGRDFFSNQLLEKWLVEHDVKFLLISGDARFPTTVELGHVQDLAFILPHLNWFYLTLKMMGVLKGTS